MKENSIKFELKTDNDKLITIEAEIEKDNTLTRMGKPVLCNCTGNTQDTATPFRYDDGRVFCPECGKESVSVTTFTDFEANELENIHLKYFGTDYITLQDLYKLSYTLPYDKWGFVEDLFMKLTPDQVDLGDFSPNIVGWVTSNPEAVEDRLNIKPELRINYHKEQALQEKKEKEVEKEKLMETVNSILEEFSIVETPESSTGMFELEGTIFFNIFSLDIIFTTFWGYN